MMYKEDSVSNKARQNHDGQEFESSANEEQLLSDVRGVACEGFIQLDNLILYLRVFSLFIFSVITDIVGL